MFCTERIRNTFHGKYLLLQVIFSGEFLFIYFVTSYLINIFLIEYFKSITVMNNLRHLYVFLSNCRKSVLRFIRFYGTLMFIFNSICSALRELFIALLLFSDCSQLFSLFSALRYCFFKYSFDRLSDNFKKKKGVYFIGRRSA